MSRPKASNPWAKWMCASRQKKHFSREQVARLLRSHAVTVSRIMYWESGKGVAKVEMMDALETLYGKMPAKVRAYWKENRNPIPYRIKPVTAVTVWLKSSRKALKLTQAAVAAKSGLRLTCARISAMERGQIKADPTDISVLEEIYGAAPQTVWDEVVPPEGVFVVNPFADWLKQTRQRRGLTQEQLAEKVDNPLIRRKILTAYETGRAIADTKRSALLEGVLGPMPEVVKAYWQANRPVEPVYEETPLTLWLVERRNSLGLDCKEVVARLESYGLTVCWRTYRSWELGRGRPSSKSIPALEKLFGKMPEEVCRFWALKRPTRAAGVGDLADWLRVHRMSLGLSKEMVADKLADSPITVHKIVSWEAGRSTPCLGDLNALESVLGPIPEEVKSLAHVR